MLKSRKKQKGKMFRFLSCVALTAVFAAVSVWGYLSAESKKKENYDYILANASSASDYYEAIVTDTSRTDAYLGNADKHALRVGCGNIFAHVVWAEGQFT